MKAVDVMGTAVQAVSKPRSTQDGRERTSKGTIVEMSIERFDDDLP